MRPKAITALLAATAVLGANSYPGLWVDVSSETIPPGGTVQVKYTLTESAPISVPGPKAVFDPDLFDGLEGVNLFNGTGDVYGVALVQGSTVLVNYISPNGSFGTDIQDPYPWMTIAMHVRQDAPVGANYTLSLGPYDPEYQVTVDPGTFVVGGTLSISNVIPGGGWVPASKVVTVQGTGFYTGVRVSAPGLCIASMEVVSSTEIQLTLGSPAVMDGQEITVSSGQASSVTYYSYLRGTPVAVSSLPLFAAAVPIFSTRGRTFAQFAALQPIPENQVYGLAVENPGANTTRVSVSLYAPNAAFVTETTLYLPSGGEIAQTLTELFGGVTPQAGSTIEIRSSHEFRTVGLLGDTNAGTVLPLVPL